MIKTMNTTSASTIIRFSGVAIANHAMDIADLAPSLLSLSSLVQESNRLLNGEAVKIKVTVNADLKQNCFELLVTVGQTVASAIHGMFDEVKTYDAEEIAKIIGVTGSASVYTLYKLIKIFRGKTITKVEDNNNGTKNIHYVNTINGDGNSVTQTIINVPSEAFRLLENEKTRKLAVDVLAPLRKAGYESMVFDDAGRIAESFGRDDAENNAESNVEILSSQISVSKITAAVRIKKAMYEGRAKWTVIYRRPIDVTIDDYEWLEKFQNNKSPAPPNSTLHVDMEETFPCNEKGEAIGESEFRITKVHKVDLPPKQQMFDV